MRHKNQRSYPQMSFYMTQNNILAEIFLEIAESIRDRKRSQKGLYFPLLFVLLLMSVLF